MKLIVEETDPQLEAEDISHVYSGYAPLSVRIIEHLSKPGGLRGIEEVMKLLPGPHFDLKQEMPKGFKSPGTTVSLPALEFARLRCSAMRACAPT
jgi:hypothetical protein